MTRRKAGERVIVECSTFLSPLSDHLDVLSDAGSSPREWCSSGSFDLLMVQAVSSRVLSVFTSSVPVSATRVSLLLARM
ncbi:hypothetical protein, partial [Microbacterium sp.]|uniref:hypothetical protein n=1 Tax=Microbacterium sp. TaxID=51671 RepID=UPI003736BAAA